MRITAPIIKPTNKYKFKEEIADYIIDITWHTIIPVFITLSAIMFHPLVIIWIIPIIIWRLR